jgi:hypothetical protein
MYLHSYDYEILHYAYITYFAYPFICWMSTSLKLNFAVVKSPMLICMCRYYNFVAGLYASKYIHRNTIARLYGSYILRFFRNIHLISIVVALIYIATNNVQNFLFLASLLACVVFMMRGILSGLSLNLNFVLICIYQNMVLKKF